MGPHGPMGPKGSNGSPWARLGPFWPMGPHGPIWALPMGHMGPSGSSFSSSVLVFGLFWANFWDHFGSIPSCPTNAATLQQIIAKNGIKHICWETVKHMISFWKCIVTCVFLCFIASPLYETWFFLLLSASPA